MRDTNLGREPDPVTEFLDEYAVVEQFRTELGRLNVQSLGMFIHGTNPIEHELLEWADGHACAYFPPDTEFAAVLAFTAGWGYYCCQTRGDLDAVDEWFRAELDAYVEDDLSLVQLDADEE